METTESVPRWAGCLATLGTFPGLPSLHGKGHETCWTADSPSLLETETWNFLKLRHQASDTADDLSTNKMFSRYAWQQQQHFLQPPFRFRSSLKTETCFILIVSLQCDEPRNSWSTAGGYQRRSLVQCTLGYYVFLTGWTANKIPVLHEQALPACRARWLWVGLSALLSLLTFQVILVWETGENLYLLKTTKVCVCSRVAREALQKVGWCTSPHPTSLEPLVRLQNGYQPLAHRKPYVEGRVPGGQSK